MKLYNGQTEKLETSPDFIFEGDKLFFDTETTSLSHLTGQVFMISWTDKHGHSYALDLREYDADVYIALDKLRKIAVNPDIEKIGHNVRFDVHFLRHLNFKFVKVTDTLVMARVANNRRVSYKLKDLAVAILNADISEKKELDTFLKKSAESKQPTNNLALFDAAPRPTGSAGFENVPFNVISKYAVADVKLTCELFFNLQADLIGHELWPIHELEKKVLAKIIEIESRGFLVDVAFLKLEKMRVEKELATLAAEIKAEIGDMNILSNDDLAEILFGKLKLVPCDMTDTGKPKMTKFTLDRYADKHPFVAKIKEYRDRNQYLSTFISGLLDREIDGVIYAEFNQLNAKTGRMSSSNPNMQNIPKRDEAKAEIRKAFLARDGYVLVSFDYSQIEYRLFAHYTNSPRLIKLYEQDFDFHAETGKLFNKSRGEGKTLNFGIVYGMGAAALAAKLGCDIDTGKKYLADYFAQIPEAKRLKWTIQDKIKERGFLKSLLGRRSYMTEDEAYKGLNALIQMVAADIFKQAVVDVGDYVADKDAHIVNLVHDDIVLEIPVGALDIVPEIKRIMESVAKIRVPIKVDVNYGLTWGDSDKWEPDAEKRLESIVKMCDAVANARSRNAAELASICPKTPENDAKTSILTPGVDSGAIIPESRQSDRAVEKPPEIASGGIVTRRSTSVLNTAVDKPETVIPLSEFKPKKSLKDFEYFRTANGVLYCCDCLEVLACMDDNSIDLAITSPPYNIGADKYVEYADNLTDDEFFLFQKKLIDLLLKKVINQTFYNIQMVAGNKIALFKLVGAFAEKIKEVIIWNKTNPPPGYNDNLMTSAFEFIFCFDNADSGRRVFKNGQFKRGDFSNVINMPINHNKICAEHSAIFPEKLVYELLNNFSTPEFTVVDPFFGTGTTGLVCEKLNRKWVGIDISAQYCEIAKKRIEAESNQIKLF